MPLLHARHGINASRLWETSCLVTGHFETLKRAAMLPLPAVGMQQCFNTEQRKGEED